MFHVYFTIKTRLNQAQKIVVFSRKLGAMEEMIMTKKDYNTYDRINLRDLCSEIVIFSKGHRTPSALSMYSSRDAILKQILPNTSDWAAEIKQINKLASGNGSIESLKMIPQNIEQKEFRSIFMKKCAVLERTIRKTAERGSINMNGMEFLQSFLESSNSIFFNEDEITELNECFFAENVSETLNFVGLLFFHALTNIAINLPHLTAERFFCEALSLTPNTSMYIKLMKCAADCGHGYAALVYANQIYNKDPENALEYFIIASGLRHEDSFGGRPTKLSTESNALWEIAYMFENHKINENKISYVDSIIGIDKKLDDIVNNRLKLDDDETIGQRYDPDNTLHLRDYILGFSLDENEANQVIQYTADKCTIYALKLYLYIAKKDLSFPKAFNSLGKLILGDYISNIEQVPKKDIEKQRFELAKNYLDTAIHFGNINAMVKLAIFYHNKLRLGKTLTKSEEREMRYYFEIASEMDERNAQQHLGEILMSEGNYKRAVSYLKYAADKGVASACHSLGKVYAVSFRNDEAIEYFEKAISLDYHDAAYDLAEIYLLYKSCKAGEPLASTYRQYAIHLLENGMPHMSEAYKEKTKGLLDQFSANI